MKLIELYLSEVRRHLLLRKNRDDIIEEIRSTLMDTVEDRNPNPGQEPDEETIKTVLKEYGSPRKMADQYGTKNFLIGPRLFPLYILVLKIVLIVVGAVGLLGLFIGLISQSGFESGILGSVLEILGDLFGGLFTAFSFVTLSFAAIERTTPEDWEVDLDEDWDPEHLHEEEDYEHVKIAELAVEITMNIFFIAVLNFFYDKIGIYYLNDTGWNSIPILNANFPQYIPWITSYIVLDIALALYLIRMGYWDKFSSIGKILVNIFKIAVTFAILSGPAILTIDTMAWQAMFSNAQMTSMELSNIANTALNVLLGLSIFGMAVDSIKRLYLSFIKGRSAIKFKAE